MTTNQIKSAYLNFFKQKGHAVIPSAPLVPQEDPTTLFNGSGMQQLVPFLKGETHSMGKRLVNSQPCFRAEDIEEVGDNRHTTYFEMLGNWSLGNYFKKEQLTWIWEFFTQILNLDPKKLYVTISAGGQGIPKDEDSEKIWLDIGIPKKRIFAYPIEEENWWSRAGSPDKMPPGEIGGPDSEVFYEFTQVKHDKKYGKNCHPNCDCGRFLEIGNSVFMEYEKLKNGSFKLLPNQNVDFGGGLERLTAAVQNTPDIFQIDIFKNLIQLIEESTNQKYQGSNQSSMRIIADHLRAAKAMIGQGLIPSNKKQGYVLRRLIRRSAVKFRQLAGELKPDSFSKIIDEPVLIKEINKFQKSLNKGFKLIESTSKKDISAQFAFDLYQTYGVPFGITQEILADKNITINLKSFEKAKEKHAQKSRTASAGMFKGGLEDQKETTTKLHTATHLLHQALRIVLGSHVRQEGSNITTQRLRFDFSHSKPLTNQELKKVESIINQQIKKNLKVKKTIQDKNKALKSGALAFFKTKYPEKVTVYTIGDFSKEFCGGPHVSSTGEIGDVKLIKEQSIAAGKRRIYAGIDYGNKKPAQQI